MKPDFYDWILGIALIMLVSTLPILAGGYVAYSLITATPDCPQEDSCYADYYDGEWHIIPGSPPWREQELLPND